MSVGRWTAVVLVMSLLVLSVACSSSARRQNARAVKVAALRASLLEADRAWAAAEAASDTPLDVLESLLVEDVHVLPPEAPMARGRAESLVVFAELYRKPGFSLSWSPKEAIVDDEGSLGVTIGEYRMALQDADGLPVTIEGKYMTVWVRREDGSWGVTADMFNADGPPAPAAQ